MHFTESSSLSTLAFSSYLQLAHNPPKWTLPPHPCTFICLAQHPLWDYRFSLGSLSQSQNRQRLSLTIVPQARHLVVDEESDLVPLVLV